MFSLSTLWLCLVYAAAVSEAMTTARNKADVTTVAYGLTRLVGGGQPDRGRLEVSHNGAWGTVCDHHIEQVDARVVCYSLGYGRVGQVLEENVYGPGTGEIWLHDVECIGLEPWIGNCSNDGWGDHHCEHIDDVAIACWDRPTEEPSTTAIPPTTTVPEPTPTGSYPDLPLPYTELSMGAEMVARDMTMTIDCLNQYTDQFEKILDGQLVKADGQMQTLCPGASPHVVLTRSTVNMYGMNDVVSVSFEYGLHGTGDETLNNHEACAYSLADYMAVFDNWKQPIWIDIDGCARLEFTSSSFALTNAEWKCPSA